MKRRELEPRLRIAGCYWQFPCTLDQSENRSDGSRSPAQRDQGAIGKQDLEEFERGMKVEQSVAADHVLTRLAPKQSIHMLQTFLAMELPMTTEWEVYEQACRLAVDLNHHLFDNLWHAVDLYSPDTLFITADTQYFRKAAKLGHIIELKDFPQTS